MSIVEWNHLILQVIKLHLSGKSVSIYKLISKVVYKALQSKISVQPTAQLKNTKRFKQLLGYKCIPQQSRY